MRPSRTSGTASYSWACCRNASWLSSEILAPPASFISARRRALPGQHAGPVTRQLGLAVPLFQARDDHPQPDVTDREPGQPGGQPGQVVEHGPVDRVTGQRVPELVADREPQFLLIEQVH